MLQLSYQFSIVTVIFIARFLYPKMICIVDCWYNAWPIRDFAVYESDDEYNNMASDVLIEILLRIEILARLAVLLRTEIFLRLEEVLLRIEILPTMALLRLRCKYYIHECGLDVLMLWLHRSLPFL